MWWKDNTEQTQCGCPARPSPSCRAPIPLWWILIEIRDSTEGSISRDWSELMGMRREGWEWRKRKERRGKGVVIVENDKDDFGIAGSVWESNLQLLSCKWISSSFSFTGFFKVFSSPGQLFSWSVFLSSHWPVYQPLFGPITSSISQWQ